MSLIQFLFFTVPPLLLLAGAYGVVRYFEFHDRQPHAPGE